MSDICSWIFAGGHSPVLGKGHKQKVSEDGVQDQQNNQKIRGGKKTVKKNYYTCEEIGKCETYGKNANRNRPSGDTAITISRR